MSRMLEYSDHIQKRLKQRRISQEQIEETIHRPDKTEPSHGGRYLAQKEFYGRILQVVAVKEVGKIVLITVYWKKPVKEN